VVPTCRFATTQRKRAVRYKSCATGEDETVYLHPTSALKSAAPQFLVYVELLATVCC
jgi:hypothetical protein